LKFRGAGLSVLNQRKQSMKKISMKLKATLNFTTALLG
jgi:hypothetical protein